MFFNAITLTTLSFVGQWSGFQFIIAAVLFAISSFFLTSFISLFLSDPTSAVHIAGLISFMFSLGGILTNGISSWLVKFFYFIPAIVLTGYSNANATTDTEKVTYNKGNLEIVILGLLCVLYGFLYVYCDYVLPDEYGIAKHPCFCLKRRKKVELKETTSTNDNDLYQGLIDDEDRNPDDRRKNFDEKNQKRRESNPNAIVLETENLTKTFGKFTAVDNVNFSIREAEITCILGHNGAGKSTLINMICGIFGQTSGRIILRGHDISDDNDALEGKVGYCPSYNVFFPEFNVKEYLDFIATIKLIKNKEQEIKKWTDFFDMDVHLLKKTESLSGGWKKKLNMAAALIGSPDILFLDEPSSGVDPASRRELWEVIRALKTKNSALVMTTHHLEEAEELANDIMFLSQGKIAEYGTVNYIKKAYGSGYEIIVDKLDEASKQELTYQVLDNWKYFKINDSDYNKFG